MITTASPWKLKEPKNPLLYFVVLYFILLVLYGFYAWGISALMENIIFKNRTWDNSNPIQLFVVFSAGIIFVVLNGRDVQKEKMKARLFNSIVLAYDALIDKVYSNLSPSRGWISVHGPQTVIYSSRSLVFEVTLMKMMSLILLLWQFSSASKLDAEGNEMLNTFSNIVLGFKSNVPLSFSDFMRSAASSNWGMAMFSMIERRINILCDEKVLIMGNTRVAPVLDRVRARIEEFISYTQTGTFWWINVTTRIFGVLYLFAVPFMLWPTQGILTILWSEIVFVVFGSHVVYRFFIADVFMSPTKWDVGPIVDMVTNLAAKADMNFDKIQSESGEEKIKTTITTIVRKYLHSSSYTYVSQHRD